MITLTLFFMAGCLIIIAGHWGDIEIKSGREYDPEKFTIIEEKENES